MLINVTRHKMTPLQMEYVRILAERLNAEVLTVDTVDDALLSRIGEGDSVLCAGLPPTVMEKILSTGAQIFTWNVSQIALVSDAREAEELSAQSANYVIPDTQGGTYRIMRIHGIDKLHVQITREPFIRLSE